VAAQNQKASDTLIIDSSSKQFHEETIDNVIKRINFVKVGLIHGAHPSPYIRAAAIYLL